MNQAISMVESNRIYGGFLALVLTLALTACGQEDPAGQIYNDASATRADEVFVALDKANPAAVDEYEMLVSFPSVPTSAGLCVVSGADCPTGSYVTLKASQALGGRQVYRTTSPVRIDSAATYAVKYDLGSGVKLKKFKFASNTSGTTTIGQPQVQPIGTTTGTITWRALLATGDNEFRAWDNARSELAKFWLGRGIKSENMKQLSMTASLQTGEVGATSKANVQSALQTLTASAAPTDACLIFMTSHGSPQGFFLRGQSTISPSEFGNYLDKTCGNRPTVAIVSACYSGVMIDEATKKPNRIILTAARRDRTSFGCDASSKYTYFDECVIETLPKVKTWKSFAEQNRACVDRLERERGITKFSEPQTFIGEQVADLATP